ncbi:MAG TPA: hypothetical protein VGP93_19225, partial [Polyangiaceae bacterium]|nr:hypothetical protein [Polyangiaceae bacterium]
MTLVNEIGRIALRLLVALAMAGAVACQGKHRTAVPSKASAALPAASAPSSALPDLPGPAAHALAEALKRWDVACNAGDRQGLEAAYAESLNLYEQFTTREEVVRRKLDEVAKRPTFSQSVLGVTWNHWDENEVAHFTKVINSEGLPPNAVTASLVFKQENGAWVIIDENDSELGKRSPEWSDPKEVASGVPTVRPPTDDYLGTWRIVRFETPAGDSALEGWARGQIGKAMTLQKSLAKFDSKFLWPAGKTCSSPKYVWASDEEAEGSLGWFALPVEHPEKRPGGLL